MKADIRNYFPVRIAAAAAAFAVLVMLLAPFCVRNVYAADNTMSAVNYNVTVKVSEDSSFDYHEHLDINYVTPHHGIYRYIPINGTKISKIKVPGYKFETYTNYGSKVIKIGSGDYTLMGLNSYDITYNIAMFKDNDASKDMLLLNLIPTDWETDILNASAVVTLPKAADLSKVQVFSGTYGTEGNEDNAVLTTSDDGLTITITALVLPAHHGITVVLELPEGYWTGALEFGKTTPWMLLLALLGPAGAFLLWYIYGRDEKLVRTLEFYPPDGMTPGEAGYVIDGVVDKRDVVSTIVYLADKGYITIDQKNRKEFIFTSIEAPGKDEPQYVRTIYAGLFADGKDSVSSRKLGTSFGRKFETAGNQLERMFSGKKSITDPDSSMARIGGTIASLMPTVAFVTWADYSGDDIGWYGIVWAGFHVLLATALMCSVYDKIRAHSKGITIAMTLLALWFFTIGLGVLVISSDTIINVSTARAGAAAGYLVLGTIVSIFFTVIGTARRSEYTRLLGRILGFRDFIKTAELDKLKELVEEDPEYFYHIMPYAYVFGLSDKWIKNFEDIPMYAPHWYAGEYMRYDSFDAYMMGRMMSDCSSSVSSNIVIPSSEGRSYSGSSGWSGGGGGFSGGGFSGGGAGGGGGGGW